MAGDWIKVESATADKPEVLRLARALKISRVTAFGAVVIFWSWLDRNASDGVVDGVVGDDVDALVGIPGFAAALQGVGWLALDAKIMRLTVPNYGRLNGQSAKNRALKNARQARWRGGIADPVPAAAKPKTPRVNGNKVSFDFDKGEFIGLGELQILAWQDAYPALIIDPEIARAAAWLKANPANLKKNYERFLVNWFSKAQDRAPRIT